MSVYLVNQDKNLDIFAGWRLKCVDKRKNIYLPLTFDEFEIVFGMWYLNARIIFHVNWIAYKRNI